MAHEPRTEVLESLLSELAEAQVTAAICLERIRQEVERTLHGAGAAAWPVVEPAGFNVLWRGKVCHLGPGTSFRLFARLLRRTNQFVTHQELLRDVWRGDSRTPATVRSAVRHLRTRLAGDGMGELALAIRGRAGHYGLILARRP